jgi:glycosyltransferase involved in cell wall biosynthesis
VICAYTQARWTELVQAVESATRQSRPPQEVVVVIDHNAELLTRSHSAFADICVVANQGRRGLCGARNTGLNQLHTDVVAFLDDDARADRDWLAQMASGFGDPGVIGVGGWVDPSWEGAAPRWLAPELYWIVGCSYRGLPARVAPIRNAIGANMSFRREVLVSVGGFREDIGQTHERSLRDDETDLAIRTRSRWPEARIMHVPAARVEHSVPRERARWRYLFSRCWGEGLGKALLARSVGPSAALSTERTYVSRVLPAAVAGGLLDAVRGDLAGLARSASVVAALAVTAAGYVFGRMTAVGSVSGSPGLERQHAANVL